MATLKSEPIEVCACDESNAYRAVLEACAHWLADVGVPRRVFIGDNGAAQLLKQVRAALAVRS